MNPKCAAKPTSCWPLINDEGIPWWVDPHGVGSMHWKYWFQRRDQQCGGQLNKSPTVEVLEAFATHFSQHKAEDIRTRKRGSLDLINVRVHEV